MLLEQRLVHGAQQNKDTDQDDDPGDGAGQDIDGCFHQGVTGHDGVCAAEVGLADDAQNQTEDHGRAVELAGGEDEADEAGDGHQDNVNCRVLGRVSADGRHHDDGGAKDAVGDFQHLHEDAGDDHGCKDHDDVGDKHGSKCGRQELGLIDQQQGAHGNALEHQSAHHNGSRVAAGDAQAQQGDHGAAGGGVVA